MQDSTGSTQPPGYRSPFLLPCLLYLLYSPLRLAAQEPYPGGVVFTIIPWALSVLLPVFFIIFYRKQKKRMEHEREAAEKVTEHFREQMEVHQKELECLHRVTRMINKKWEHADISRLLVKEAVEICPGARSGSFIRYNPERDLFEWTAVQGFPPDDFKEVFLTRGEAVSRYVRQGREVAPGIYVIREVDKIEDSASRRIRQHAELPQAILAMEILFEKQAQAFLLLHNHQTPGAFDELPLDRLVHYREHVIAALHQGRLRRRREEEKQAAQAANQEARRAREKLNQLGRELDKAYRELELTVRTDPLTQLSNRKDIMERIAFEVLRTERSKNCFCLIMADIDDLKGVNQACGNDYGDFVLVRVSRIMESLLRKQDSVGRWGEEEFMIVLPETDLQGGTVVAERIREKVAGDTFARKDLSRHITITLGLSIFDKNNHIDDCIKEAVEALHLGKEQGKNRVVASSGH